MPILVFVPTCADASKRLLGKDFSQVNFRRKLFTSRRGNGCLGKEVQTDEMIYLLLVISVCHD